MLNSESKKSVMGRVRLVYALRRATNPIGFKVGSFVVLSSILTWFVSVISVIRNFLSSATDIITLSNFTFQTFLNAGHTVQTILLGMIAVIVFFVRDLYRIVSFSRGSEGSKAT